MSNPYRPPNNKRTALYFSIVMTAFAAILAILVFAGCSSGTADGELSLKSATETEIVTSTEPIVADRIDQIPEVTNAPNTEIPREPTDAERDQAYLSVLEQSGVHGQDPDEMVEAGREVCNALEEGVPPELIFYITTEAGFTDDEAAVIMGASVGAFCEYQSGIFDE